MGTVVLVAFTQVHYGNLQKVGYNPHDPQVKVSPADELTEAAGRICYKAYERKNPATLTNQGYLDHIITAKHLSIMRHASATFWVVVSRPLSMELIRHGFLDPSMVSQRYVDQKGTPVVYPPAVIPFLNESLYPDDQNSESYFWSIKEEIDANHEIAQDSYERLQKRYRELGLDRKEANGAARYVLPEGTQTELFITGNHQAYREFIEKRNSVYADQEIRELAQELLRQLKGVAPNCYQDMSVEV